MRRGVPHGYTIVEVMIFLAVTGALFAMIAITFAGQRGRTQFQTAAREVESQIRDIVNNTSSGYYQTNEDFTCTANPSGPQFSNAANDLEQGANQGCIFLGPAMRFTIGSGDYQVYTVAGLRRVAVENKEVENFDETNPRAVVGAGINITENLTLPNGVTVASMFYNNGGSDVSVDGVGFFTSFGRYETDALQPNSLSVNVMPLFSFSGSGCTAGNVVCQVTALGNPALSVENYLNPSNGLTLCFNSGTSNQHAILTIGGANRQLTTDLTIGDGQSAGDSRC
jgi:type II secretory pathway pseudopilin PulG